jgi:hypothetical protein
MAGSQGTLLLLYLHVAVLTSEIDREVYVFVVDE